MRKQLLLITILAIAITAFVINGYAQTEKAYKTKTDVLMLGTGTGLLPIEDVIIHFRETRDRGFQSNQMPRFIISTNDKKFMFTIGGYVNFRGAYDFDGVVNNVDFVTYNIPTTKGPADRQRLLMDASTTRLYFKTITNSSPLGRIETYIETDFRGYDNNLRLRKAYISFMGFLFGKNVTTFSDLMAAPTTIDFQGPNAYTYNYALMARYTRKFGDHWSAAVALEMPKLSATFTNATLSIPQRLPDVPVYVQYAWNENNNHVRLSGIFRDLLYHDQITDENRSQFGWGAQLSLIANLTPKLSIFGEAIYGKGITPYINDLVGTGLDLVENPDANGKLQALPMYGFVGGLQYDFCERLFASATYSQVRINGENNYFNANGYRNATYLVGNVFYSLTPACQIGVEYLNGMRKNMNMNSGSANRVQASIQYNF